MGIALRLSRRSKFIRPFTPPPSGGGNLAVRGVSVVPGSIAPNIVISKPDGTVATDVMYVSIGHMGGASNTITPPPGWTLLYTTGPDDPTSTNLVQRIFRRIADGSEGSSFTFTANTSAAIEGRCVTVSGAHQTYTEDVPLSFGLHSFSSGSAGEITAPPAYIYTSGTLALGFFVVPYGGGQSWTPPPGMTELADTAAVGGPPFLNGAVFSQTGINEGEVAKTAITAATHSAVVGQMVFIRAAGASERPPFPTPVGNVYNIAPPNHRLGISQVIRQIPNGANNTNRNIIRFPAAASYVIGHRIEVNRRQFLTIDLNGSTVRNTRDNNDLSGAFPNFYMLRNDDLTVTNGTLIGNFPSCGPRNLGTLCGFINPVSANAGVTFYGGNNVEASYLTIKEVMGDGVQTSPSWVEDASIPHGQGVVTNLKVHHCKITTTARHGLSVSGGIGVWLEDNELNDSWYGGIDTEIDAAGTPLRDVHILRNTLNGFGLFGISVPAFGASGDVNGVEIRQNEFLTPQDQCNWAIQINYWEGPNVWAYNIVVEDNICRYRNIGITMAWVNGGSISNNDFIWYSGCSRQLMNLHDNIGITIAGNTDN